MEQYNNSPTSAAAELTHNITRGLRGSSDPLHGSRFQERRLKEIVYTFNDGELIQYTSCIS